MKDFRAFYFTSSSKDFFSRTLREFGPTIIISGSHLRCDYTVSF